jgi:uncharacterized protein (TIGR00299 family) protein
MTEFYPIAIIDCQIAGIAGDMLLGALLDIGADATKITCAIKSLESTEQYGYSNIKVDIKHVTSKNFRATKVSVTSDEKSAKTGKQLIEIVEKTVQNLKLSTKAKQYASNVIRTLVNTEAGIHNISLCDDVHLHEIGLVDTAAEIIGVAVALDDLGFFNAKIYATPVSVGGGLFKFSHGITSSPSPAALAIFQSKKFPIKGGPVEFELATPTGAALLVNLVSEVTPFYPKIVPVKVGYGAGDKEFFEIPNVLRIIFGESLSSLESEQISVLETSVDDVSGEIIGHTVDRLFLEGARDVSVVPVFTKKNRPAQIIKVVADKNVSQRLIDVLIEETGTLGVRVYCCERYVVSRSIFPLDLFIAGQKEVVNIKVSKNGQGKIVRLKPEFEDLKCLAEKTGVSLRELSEVVLAKARAVFMGD